MAVIREADLIDSVADALQYISYYHSPDFIAAMGRAYEAERSPAARDAIAQILTNSRLCAEGHRPICQDTGIVVVFVKVGMNVRWDAQRTPTPPTACAPRSCPTRRASAATRATTRPRSCTCSWSPAMAST